MSVATHGFSLLAASRALSSLWSTGFSSWGLLLLHNMGVGMWASGIWLLGPRVQGSVRCVQRLTCPTDMWDLPGPGIEPVSPTLAGGFLTTGPGKSQLVRFWWRTSPWLADSCLAVFLLGPHLAESKLWYLCLPMWILVPLPPPPASWPHLYIITHTPRKHHTGA